MKVKELKTEDYLITKIQELEGVKATISEFEERLSELINNKDISAESKVIMIRSAYQRTLGTVNG